MTRAESAKMKKVKQNIRSFVNGSLYGYVHLKITHEVLPVTSHGNHSPPIPVIDPKSSRSHSIDAFASLHLQTDDGTAGKFYLKSKLSANCGVMKRENKSKRN